jgi:prepilin-type N-terminal cleavage/methylation domain-containing protein
VSRIKNNKTGGFTLIELLVVIAIIGILTGIIVPNLTGARLSGRDAKRISDIKNVQLSLALHYQDLGYYPYGTASGLVSAGYIGSLPTDPSTGQPYAYTVYWRGSGSGLEACNATTRKAVLFHLGAVLETNHSVLQEDSTSFSSFPTAARVTVGGVTYTQCNGTGAQFHSDSANCNSTTAGTDMCFDVGPQG